MSTDPRSADGDRTLRFDALEGRARAVGTVHADGSITFAGTLYPSIRELPPACVAFRPDLEIEARWRAHFRKIRGGRRPPMRF